MTVAEPQEAPEPEPLASAPIDKLLIEWWKPQRDDESLGDFLARCWAGTVVHIGRVYGLDPHEHLARVEARLAEVREVLPEPLTEDAIAALVARLGPDASEPA